MNPENATYVADGEVVCGPDCYKANSAADDQIDYPVPGGESASPQQVSLL